MQYLGRYTGKQNLPWCFETMDFKRCLSKGSWIWTHQTHPVHLVEALFHSLRQSLAFHLSVKLEIINREIMHELPGQENLEIIDAALASTYASELSRSLDRGRLGREGLVGGAFGGELGAGRCGVEAGAFGGASLVAGVA